MNLKTLFIIFIALYLARVLSWCYLDKKHGRQPLPAEVVHLYTPQRYKQFLDIQAVSRRLSIISTLCEVVFVTVLLFSDFFPWLDRTIGQNEYLTAMITIGIVFIASRTLDFALDGIIYRGLFPHYGVPTISLRELALDSLWANVFMVFFGGILSFCFVLESGALRQVGVMLLHNGPRTMPFSLSLSEYLVCAAMAVLLLIIGLRRLSYRNAKPLPDGALRDRIMALQADYRHRVDRLLVYDRAKHPLGAPVMLWGTIGHRKLLIADDLLEMDEDILLATIALKLGRKDHRRIWPGLTAFLGAAGVAALLFIGTVKHDPRVITDFFGWVRSSFGLTHNNDALCIAAGFVFCYPMIVVNKLVMRHESRREYLAACMDAAQNGLGDALIRMVTNGCTDYLQEITIHPVIEAIDESAPSIYTIIKTIKGNELCTGDTAKEADDR